ncbi:MAG: winged helix-turn-helix domain-containing protein [Spirochaetota bacterium]|nr:winged helix-turn-helix domain-containing protein [Spirochaetota bacterium]
MKQKSLTDVCVISEDPIFINRVKIYSKSSNLIFNYISSPGESTSSGLFLIDIKFLKELKLIDKTYKVITHGNQKELSYSFNMDCTDFLKNPWNNDELEARICKILNEIKVQIEWHKLILSQKTISGTNFSIKISIEEYTILKKLIENKDVPVPREALLFSLWGNNKDNSRVVDMHISNIRKKINIIKQHDNECCGSIKTIRSYGYMII